jgi:hypothetical protein
MNAFHTSTAAFLWLLALVGLAVADSDVDPREKLETAVPEGIRLLEAKDYSTFLKNFVPPDDLKKYTENSSFDEFAKQFGETKAPRLLQVMKAIKEVKPTVDPSGMKATYELQEPIAGKKTITWLKIDKHWYIKNN